MAADFALQHDTAGLPEVRRNHASSCFVFAALSAQKTVCQKSVTSNC